MTALQGAFVFPTGAAAGPSNGAAGPGTIRQAPDPDPEPPPLPDDEEFEEEDEGEEGDSLPIIPPAKPEPAPGDSVGADSLGATNGTFLPTGKAALDSLPFIPPGTPAGAAGAAGAKPGTTATKPPVRKSPLGIHPAAFYLLLAVGHVFLVRTVTD